MDLANKTVAVTGASGMLGPYLCRALLSAGARVRGVVRNPAKARFLEPEGVTLASAELQQRDALRDAFRGCDAVVSNAALYNLLNLSWRDNYRANKEGTENVYEAAALAGVSRVVHISTFGVYRWHLGRPPFDHASPVLDGERKQGGAYRATKQLSERLAFEISRKHGLATTALRPAGIYGARDHNLMPYLRALLRVPLMAVPRLRFPFVYAGDVAQAVVGALQNDASADQPYLIAGRSDTFYDLLRAYKAALGWRGLLLPVPWPEWLEFHVDCGKAEREIGFRNRTYLEGMQEVVRQDREYASAGIG